MKFKEFKNMFDNLYYLYRDKFDTCGGPIFEAVSFFTGKVVLDEKDRGEKKYFWDSYRKYDLCFSCHFICSA